MFDKILNLILLVVLSFFIYFVWNAPERPPQSLICNGEVVIYRNDGIIRLHGVWTYWDYEKGNRGTYTPRGGDTCVVKDEPR